MMAAAIRPPRQWYDITPEQAAAEQLNLAVRVDITAPRNEEGERCPWPWEPQQLVLAGLRHPDEPEPGGAR